MGLLRLGCGRAAVICAAVLRRSQGRTAMSVYFEELDFRPTPMGVLSLRRRRQLASGLDVYEIKLGDEFLMSSAFTVAEIALARLGLAALARADLDVVVGMLCGDPAAAPSGSCSIPGSAWRWLPSIVWLMRPPPRCRRHQRRKYRGFAAACLQEQHRRALAKAGSERVEGRTLCEGICLIRRKNCQNAP